MKRLNQRGFTLIEILIALFVLSVVLLSMSAMVVSVMWATAQSKGLTTATSLVQDKMESLKNASFSSLTPGSYSDSPRFGNITYNRQWTVSTAGNIKTIAVAVSWTDRRSHNVAITTLRGG